MESKARTYIDECISANKVFLFSKSYCPHCVKAKEALTCKGIEYELVEIDGLENSYCAEIQDELRSMTGARTVPRVFINGKCIGGGSETAQLCDSGEITKLLK